MIELISQLTSNLNIGDDQAKGGLGAILNLAKDQLDGGDFSKITDVLGGGTDDVMALASAKTEGGGGGLMGALGGLAGGLAGGLGGGLGDALGGLGKLAQLAGTFKNFNMDSGLLQQFVPIVMGFLKDKGGDGVAGILGKLLGQD